VTAPEGYLTLADAAAEIGVPVATNGGILSMIHQVDAETGERRLPAEWVELPIRQSPEGGYWIIRREDVAAFKAKPRRRGGGQKGARGNVRRWQYSPLRPA
jgi:hypothetical protein